ncbi:hypothetical protein E2C01_033322 [Portunus trituberculatus]|uniref:Uncharacterized protein n=1 Tax=Portunus trituberculatus TaxID=210409 RepID=A0A5B7F3W9_PORTR|nr:hypothetical protein [Portunus trituberculatus]
MILASILHHYNQQHQQQQQQQTDPTLTETPYVPALHGPFHDAAPPAPPTPAGLPPAPPQTSAVDVSLLPQADEGHGSSGDSGGGLSACVEGGGCALLLSGLLALAFTTPFITPAVLPAFGLLGGRRRRSVALGEASPVLDFLRQHRAELLAAGVERVEAKLHRPLDHALLQTLEEGDPRHVLPLLRHALRSPAPRSPDLIRQICEAAAQPVALPSQARVITAQHCLLLAAVHHL